MNDTTLIVLAALGLGTVYMFTRPKPVAVGMPITTQPNQQYPVSMGQTQYGGYPGGLPYPGTVGSQNQPTAAQQAAGVISAIGGLASGIGSVVRGIGDIGSSGDGGGGDDFSDTV